MLTERQMRILQAIINNYIHSAEPVGSRTLFKQGDIGYSSATIRNEMADLEELGFLEQPHISSGRIPSEKGYRFYVDHLIEPHLLTREDLINIKKTFAEKYMKFEELIQQTTNVLSQLTNYTAILLGTEVFETKLKHLQFVPLSAKRAVAIMVTDNGRVEHKVVTIPDGISVYDMEKVVNILNHKLAEVPIFQLKQRLYSEVSEELRKHVQKTEKVLLLLEQTLTSSHEDKVYIGGTTNILSQPEFRDVDKVKSILELLQKNQLVSQLLPPPTEEEGIQIRIGHENGIEEVNHCTLISASYYVDGQPMGTIGILGPTRMEYSKVIAILEHISKDLSIVLKKWQGE
ncbi:heat-inducible transcriptional repressor HrcA [Microaerobacter geothermalis]|uniref:heat-inducible transcriptional repressor HrcA n=1 Tax=Microaerobacter geothermalis TaxID=674972 RepID=UPI001EFFE1A0|nr:heat-inducible transcriptional repressor HrcA [Microaerobacter geothermalis]MCF6092866.1 heat-inducible transcriptional repressor HrcA [Microaerobacter geothermalis]